MSWFSVGESTGDCCDFTCTQNLAVFCIVQANRAGKAKADPVPLEAARDSGAFEENADFVLAFGGVVECRGELSTIKCGFERTGVDRKFLQC